MNTEVKITGHNLYTRLGLVRMNDVERERLKSEMIDTTGIGLASYYNYINDRREIPLTVAQAWADIFNVTIETLMNPMAQLNNPYIGPADLLKENTQQW